MNNVHQSSISKEHRPSKNNHMIATAEGQSVTSQQDLQDIWRWNATVPATTNECAHERFINVATRRHNAPAVCAWDGDLTYGELDALSTALAHRLVELGVGPNALVSLCFEKSMWTPVVMLGVMKAGGASAAMDVTQPEERLRTILRQVEPTVILSSRANESLARRLSPRPAPVVVIGDDLSQMPPATNRVLPTVRPHDLLYVVFTSGSTGAPKGVKISHRSSMSGLDHLQTPLHIHPESRVYDFASYAFDVPWGNLLLAICVGGCLCIPSQEDIYLDVSGSMNRMKATFAHLTPTVARSLDATSLPYLETIDLGGEPVLEIDKKQWAPYTTLIVTYGPAECTVSSTCEELNSAHTNVARIGKGAGVNTWVVSVDGTEQLVPIGAVGELHLEGPLVGDGYLERSEQLSAFAIDPPWLLRGTSGHAGRGGRVYRTGDLVRYDSDGSLSFIGRKDAQVKIRGQRVELGEVEQHVARNLAITRDIVPKAQPIVVAEVLLPLQSSQKILAAFIQIGGFQVESDALEAFKSIISGIEEKLIKALPIYMVPNAYIPTFPNMPMTATGKIDRQRLRAIGENYTLEQMLKFSSRKDSQPPATDMERQLQQLWATTLGIPADMIGRDDSFLQLGGDSIGAMRLVGLARRKALSLTVQDVFNQPRLNKLASAAEDQPKLLDNTEGDSIKPFSLLRMQATELELQQRVAAMCGIRSKHVQDVFPCTSLQEGLFVLTIKSPGDYIARYMFELQPHVDVERFKSAWDHTYATTPILRTRIVDLTGDGLVNFPGSGLVQTVIDERINWREGQRVDEYLQADKAQLFGFGTPLARFGLVQGENSSRYFVWTMHHALYDGWSIPLLIKRVQQAYSGEMLSPPPPFQAFVRYVSDVNKDRVNRFWREQFDGLEAQPFPTLPSNTYQSRANQTTVHRIVTQWPKSDITPSTLIRAAWSMLAAQYSGASDVVFGATVFGRQVPVAQVEEIVGPAIATVPVRVNANSEQRVDTFLETIQREGIERIPYDHTGVQYIRQASDSAEMACGFQTLLVVQPSNEGITGHSDVFEHIDGKIKGIDNPGDDYFAHKTYALQLLCNLEDDGVQVRFNYDSNVIDVAQLARMANQLGHLLDQLCATSNGPRLLKHLESISQQDIADIWSWNRIVPETVDACVHDVIAKTAQRCPDAEAVCAWDGVLTYRELDQLSTKLAVRLLEHGSVNAPIPLCFEKSMWMAVAMLGVMKAGGASVAVDSTQPEERLRTIVQQVKPTVILSSLSNQELASRLLGDAAEPSKAVIVVDKSHLDSMQCINEQKLPKVSPQDLLYVVFTSGSTGTPKGAMVSHYNFSSAIKHQKSYLRCSEAARVYDFPSYSFDVAWLTALHTLSAGGCLCVPSETDRKTNIAASIRSLRANIAHIVPTIARVIDREFLSSLDLVVTGGEAMTTDDFLTWGNLPNLTQVYGPAECVPPVTLTSSTLQSVRNVGRGVGVNIWLVDPSQDNELSPIGAVGEVLVEGPLVGQGYYSDHARTAVSFIKDPLWLLRGTGNDDGRRGRLYKTGDLARYDSDGTLTILGRKDGQVKIRGQRVELGDIEHQVARNLNGDVESLVVVEVFTPRESSTQILAAFISILRADQGKTDEQINDSFYESVNGLEKKLSNVLPVYMVPNAYIPVLTMPLTATGKIDRRQLRAMGENLTIEDLAKFDSFQKERKSPETDMERRLQLLWAKTLGIKEAETISRDDSFLRLGGDSIAALRLVALARASGLSVTMQDLFSQPRLRDLALAVQEFDESIVTEEDDDIEPFSLLRNSNVEVRESVAEMTGVDAQLIEDVYPCTALQEGLFALTVKRPGDYVARFALKLQPDIDLEMLREAWEEMVATTPILRTRIVELQDEGLVQVVIDDMQELHAHNHLGEYVEEDKQRNLGLGSPLARFALIDDGSGHDRYFVWTMHHALYDGWSMPLLLTRFEQAYAGENLDMPPPFQSFVKHIIDMNRNHTSKQFWESYLADIEAQPFPALPSSSYQPKADKTLTHHVKELQWPNADITPSTLLRAAWSILAAQYSGTSDVVFGVTVFGRQAANVLHIEDIVGPTTATVPVRVRLESRTSLNALLQQIQQQSVQMMQFEQTGLQNIRRINHDTEQACQFQSVLVVQPVQQEGIADSKVFRSLQAAEAILGSDNVANAFNTYSLQLICSLEENGLQLNVSYDSRVLSSATADRIPRQLEHILRQICKSENGPRMLNEIEQTSQQDILDIWRWNATVPEAADACCVHDLISKTAHRYPDAQAVCAWDGNLTYHELDELSTKLALHLLDSHRASNGNTHAPIPLCFEKSMWSPIAMLGVMKAGFASVAMDSTQPEERLHTIIQQVKPALILSSFANQDLAGRLVDRSATVVVVNKEHLAGMGQCKGSVSLPQVNLSDWIYITFTSGSTGLPKGAIATHANLAAAVRHQRDSLKIDATSRIYDFTSYAWDLAWVNFVHGLTAGGCLCVPSASDRTSDIIGSINRLKANYAYLTPSTSRTLDPTMLPGLRTMNLVGEAIFESDRTQWTPYVSLINTYGPSECSALCTYENVDADSTGVPRIGRGIGANTWIVTADGVEKLAGLGTIGELFLEGPIVGAGYLGDAKSTATAFVHDPPWLILGAPGIPGRSGRLYRTGDLVKYDPDGSLKFVGRKDAQVKIRGQRVDLGDIEHHVAESLDCKAKPIVVADVFTPREGASKVVGAFICVANAEEMPEAELHTELRKMTIGLEEKLFKVLPIYMIPNAYIPVRSITKSITGKIDRRQLRAIGENLTLEQLTALDPSRTERRRPATETERQLQNLWAATLGVNAETIGRDDSFLRLGGDSISAMRLGSLARKQGLMVTVQDVFKQPKLSDLALAVEQPAKILSTEHNNVEPFSLLRTKASSVEVQEQVARACEVGSHQVEDVFPCTALQEGLFVLTVKRPGDYVATFALDLSSMDVGRFQAAWEQTVATTPILRTRIVELTNEGLVQAVLDQRLIWRQESQPLDDYIAADKREPFGSGTALSRFAIIDSGLQRYFVWTMHHALYDGWSMPRLIDRVDRAYRGEALSVPPPFQSFVQHIVSADASDTKRFWEERFAGLATQPFPVIPSSTYQPKANETVIYNIAELEWPKSNVTKSTLVRAAWSILAGQYSGTNDVVFGVTGFGRQVPVSNVEEMIGPAIATVPARVLLDSSRKLQDLLDQVQQDAVSTLPFEQTGLQNIRRINYDTEQACQFQTLLTIQPAQQRNMPHGDIASGLKVTANLIDHGKATNVFNTYALHLVCSLGEQGVEIRISYDPQIMPSAMAERIPHQLEHVLRQVCDMRNASRSLNEIVAISTEDMGDIWQWNAAVPESAESCLHERIMEIAQQQPNAPAVCAWDGELTYREFDELSSALAYHLMELGVGLNSLVSLCFEKSMWTSVAMLAVMKAGGASSTMDMMQPEERLSTIVRQVQPKVILSSAANKDLAERLGEQPVIVVDSTRLAQLPSSVPNTQFPRVTPDDLLCVLFTSGSTGAPKGAKLIHRNATSSIKHQWDQLHVDSNTRFFDFASYAFDIAWFNFVYNFSGGACLCVPSEDERRTNLASAMRRLRATYVFLTPSVARLLEPADVPELKTLVMGGEAFVQADKDKWTPHVNYVCTYGPAECTFICTIEQAVYGTEDILRLGKKVGVNAWVVNINNSEELAPIGAVGELYLEGPLVGTGYIRNSERTAAAYIVDPPWLLRGASERPGRPGRAYRTGDLVRYDPDGGLTFVSRKDAQVKIRGQRVELGDVEHHVTKSLNLTSKKPLVIAEVIQPHQSKNQLLAVFIRVEGAESEAQVQEEVKKMTIGVEEKLTKALPIFMVPNAYIAVSSVPMTATGKIDRRRLRAIGGSLSLEQLTALDPSRTERQPPATEMEQRLQALWATTLGVDPENIGRDDSFLQLGGDSIGAMRLVALARQEGLAMTVQTVFKQTKLRDLAEAVQVRDESIGDRANGIVSTQEKDGTLVELDDAALQVLQEAGLPANRVQLATNYQSMCVYGALQTPRQWWVYCYFDLADAEIPRAHLSCQTLWETMEILRTAFFFSHGRVLQAVCPVQEAPVAIHRVEEDVQEHFESLCRIDLQEPAVLGKPFTKFFLVEAAQGPLRLAIRLSHAQYDAVTLGLIARSLNASLRGQAPPKFAQFSDFVKYTDLTRHTGIAYWQSLLSGAEMSRINTASCATCDTGRVGQEITVKRNVPMPALRQGITAATTFTAICARALAKLTQKPDLLFARLVSGRAGVEAELQNAAGACLNYVPVRIRIGATSLGEVEGTLQQQFIDALPYEGVDISGTSTVDAALAWKSDEWGCSVHYENFDGNHVVETNGSRSSIGFSRMLAGSDTHCVKIYATPGADELCISVDGCSCGHQVLKNLLGEICAEYMAL